MIVSVFDRTISVILADRAENAQSIFSRMKGLLGRKEFHQGEALIIPGCQSIHMLFMKFPIDVLFIDKSGRVIGLVEKIPPFAFSPVFWKAACAVELPAGTIAAARVQTGDSISFS